MILWNKKITFLTAVFATFSYVAQAQYVTARQIYSYAKSHDYNALSQASSNIDAQDAEGNTALCMAVADYNRSAYNTLRQYGANPQSNCMQAASQSGNGTFLGMGTTGWLVTGGVLAVGGGIAAIAASSGSSSSKKKTQPSSDCVHGTQQDGKCVCEEGYTGIKCDRDAICRNYVDSCGKGYHTTDDTCKSGTKTMYKCEADSCTGYDYTACPKGYAQSATCLSGVVLKLKCENCAEGYVKIGTECFKKMDCVNGGVQVGDKCLCPEGWEGQYCQKASSCPYNTTYCDVGYTMTGETCKSGDTTYVECVEDTLCSAFPLIAPPSNCTTESTCTTESGFVKYRCDVCKPAYGHNGKGECVKQADPKILVEGNVNNSKKSLTNTDYANVYGMSGISEDEYNALSADDAELNITNKSDGNVYGIYADYGRNAYTPLNSASGLIKIVNEGLGKTYGIYGRTGVSNAQTDNGYAEAAINIHKHGNGTIYGMYTEFTEFSEDQVVSDVLTKNADSKAGTAIASVVINNVGDSLVYGINAGATGINASSSTGMAIASIDITNIGDKNVYGMYAEYLAQNVTSNRADANGKILIENMGNGKVWGMYSNGYAHNVAGYAEAETSGLISIKNQGDGDITAITSADIRDSDSFNQDIYYFRDVSSYHLYNARANNAEATAEINVYDEGNGNITIFNTILNNGETFSQYNGNLTYNTYAFNNGTARGNINIENVSTDDAEKIITISRETLNLAYAEKNGTADNNIKITNTGKSKITLSEAANNDDAIITSKKNSTVNNIVEIVNEGDSTVKMPIKVKSNESSTVNNTIKVDNTGESDIDVYFDATATNNKEISNSVTIENEGKSDIEIDLRISAEKNETINNSVVIDNEGDSNIDIYFDANVSDNKTMNNNIDVNNTGNSDIAVYADAGEGSEQTKNIIDIKDTGNGKVDVTAVNRNATHYKQNSESELSITKKDGSIVLATGSCGAYANNYGHADNKFTLNLSEKAAVQWPADTVYLAQASNHATAVNEMNIFYTDYELTPNLPVFILDADDSSTITDTVNIQNINSADIDFNMRREGEGSIDNSVTIYNEGNNNIKVGFTTDKGKIIRNTFVISNKGNGNIVANIASAKTTITNVGNGDIYALMGDSDAVNDVSYDEGGDETGSIFIENSGNGTIKAIFAQSAENALTNSKNGVSNGSAKIISHGNSWILGIDGSSVKNARAIEYGTATATIDIENYGKGNTYGMRGRHVINADAEQTGVGEEEEKVIANGNIVISNQNGGNIYGLEGSGSDNDSIKVFNALADGKDAESTGLVKITNEGDGNIYAINVSMGQNNEVERYNDVTLVNATIENHGHALGQIEIVNNGDGDVYGIKDISRTSENSVVYNVVAGINTGVDIDDLPSPTEEKGFVEGLISIQNKGNGAVVGAHSEDEAINVGVGGSYTAKGQIEITNQGNKDIYGLKGDNHYTTNVQALQKGQGYGTITLNNTGIGNVFGMFASNVYNASGSEEETFAQGIISIINQGSGNVYGISAESYAENAWSEKGTANGLIRVSNNGTGDAYGIYAPEIQNAYNEALLVEEPVTEGDVTGNIRLINLSERNAYGMYGKKAYNYTAGNFVKSTIEMANTDNGLAVGIYAKDGEIKNSGDIKIHNLAEGTAVGIYADGSTTVQNTGNIIIDRETFVDDMATEDTADDVIYEAKSSTGGMAIGIYGASGSNITNSGTITINDAETAYGIWAEDDTVVINNDEGTIIIDGESDTENNIKLNGGKLFQNGKLIVPASEVSTSSQYVSLNLDDFGGTVVASETSKFEVEGAISGDLAINNSVVENGFDTTYSVNNMIQAGDTSGLNLVSQSALFDATLENDTDTVMTMKSFNDVIENQSMAEFLKQNYANGNNEQLFGLLKNKETLAALNDTIDSLTSSDMFNRFTFEDLTMMRDLNADMNNTLFTNNKDLLEVAGNITPWNFDGSRGSNARYALYNTTFGRRSLGLSFAFSDVRSNNGHNNEDSRYDRTFQMSVPMGYKAKGFKFITTPRFGYAYGTYDRTGYEGSNYDGKIEKRMFGLMNEARYPITMGKWSIAPSVEFNALGYHIKGREDAKEYSLNIKSQNNYSVESGVGLYANRELKPTKNSTLKINAGVAVYHEFADPYELELGMNGMDGSFKIRDDRRRDNRAVLRTGFDYNLGDNIALSGAFATYLDGTTHNNANLDFKYNF